MNALFESLPLEVQTKVKSTLSAYDICTVEKTTQGLYKVMTCTVLHCGTYNETVGEFTKDDIFTPEKQLVNYMNTFRDYPHTGYKGERNYQALNSDWTVATLVNGSFIFS